MNESIHRAKGETLYVCTYVNVCKRLSIYLSALRNRYLAACSLTTRCDKALAASHCLSRVQRPTTLDVCTYSHKAALALDHEPLATPLAAPTTHHNRYNPLFILLLFVLVCSFVLVLLLLLFLFCFFGKQFFFTGPFPCPFAAPGQRPMTPTLLLSR